MLLFTAAGGNKQTARRGLGSWMLHQTLAHALFQFQNVKHFRVINTQLVFSKRRRAYSKLCVLVCVDLICRLRQRGSHHGRPGPLAADSGAARRAHRTRVAPRYRRVPALQRYGALRQADTRAGGDPEIEK